MQTDNPITGTRVTGWLRQIVGPEKQYLRIAIVYGVAISLLSLATPISVQLLINSVANLALPTPLFTLAAILFTLLLFVAVLSAFRVHLMALFERRIFARTVAEITIRAVHARNPFFADANRSDLFNRYFDLMTVQKAVPSLLIGGFAILLQSAVGLLVTSFYHPFFLAFNVLLILLLYLIWRVWVGGATHSAVALSHAKHDTAQWLESVGGSNGFYKSSRHLDFAMDRSEVMTARYVERHRQHFHHTFAQTCACLFLYALASAALLALGGWLIIQGELSIGQLVAAELILSGVFYGVSQLGHYLETYYDLVAACEEVSLLYDIQREEPAAGERVGPANGAVSLRDVRIGATRLDLSIASGEQLVAVAEADAARLLSLLLKRHLEPDQGLVTVGGVELGSLDLYRLRSEVTVLDRPTIVEVSIREYLSMTSASAAGAELRSLERVGLAPVVARLPRGLDTVLASSGWPLTIGELMALKLANALMVEPRVLVLSPLYDLLPRDRLESALAELRAAGTTVILFTAHPEDMVLDGYLWLGRERQIRPASLAELRALAEEGWADVLSA